MLNGPHGSIEILGLLVSFGVLLWVVMSGELVGCPRWVVILVGMVAAMTYVALAIILLLG